jgi:hypothetical protein
VLRYVENEIEKFKKKKSELQREFSAYDKKMCEFYHELERIDLDTAHGKQFTKDFQDMLRLRRKAKFEYIAADKMINYLHNIKHKLTDFEENYFKDNETYKEYIYN